MWKMTCTNILCVFATLDLPAYGRENGVFDIYICDLFYLTGAAQQKVQRREMTGKAAKLAAAGACAFALVQPVMAANKKRKIEPVGCCKAHVHPHTGTLSRFLAFILAVAKHT